MTLSRARRGTAVLGELLITAGLMLLGFCAYVLWGTGVYTSEAQASLREELEQSWDAAGIEPASPAGVPGPAMPGPAMPGTPAAPGTGASEERDPVVGGGSPGRSRTYIPGQAVALLRIPSLGGSWEKVVVEGVRRADLKRGPGHYPGTAEAGEVGNFVISGHRTTYGAPFQRIDELQVDDEIVVETRTQIHTYRVLRQEIVSPQDSEVLLPVPRDRAASQKPTRRLLTLTTCHPEYSARQRLIVYAELVESAPRPARER